MIVLEKVENSAFDRGPDEECLATWWRQSTEGTAYYRCALPARYLPGQCLRLTSRDITYGETEDDYVFPRQRGAAVWQFAGDASRGALMAEMQEQGIRVLLEVDDNYLVPAPRTVGSVLQENRWYKNHGDAPSEDHYSHEAHRRIAGWVDGVIVSTPQLARQYARVNDNVFICSNQIDPVDWPELEKPDDGVLRIGWAGSASHRNDAPIARQALEWASKQDGVEVVIAGFTPPAYKFPYTRVPWADSLSEFRGNLMQLDVGLCPLVENPWAASKSDVKALEYAMAGAVPVVSRAEPYRPWWERETPSLSARTPREFLRAVQWCVAHRDELKQIAAQARDLVLAERTVGRNIWRWQEAIAPKG